MCGTRNLLTWISVAAVAVGLWFFAARVRMQLVDEGRFLVVVAIAAAVLTALYWWGIAESDDAPGPGQPEHPEQENR